MTGAAKREWVFIDNENQVVWLESSYGKLMLRSSELDRPRIGRDIARQIGEALIEYAEEQRDDSVLPERAQ